MLRDDVARCCQTATWLHPNSRLTRHPTLGLSEEVIRCHEMFPKRSMRSGSSMRLLSWSGISLRHAENDSAAKRRVRIDLGKSSSALRLRTGSR
jgi:hypothetical protein